MNQIYTLILKLCQIETQPFLLIKTKRLEKFDKLVKNDINFTKYKNNLLLLQQI